MRSRNTSFMTRPEGGWLHDDRGLAAGMGMFYSFPVKYVGTVEMPTSLQGLREEDQSGIIRESISLAVDAVLARKPKRAKTTAVKQYPFGAVAPWDMDVFLSISVTGMLIAPRVHGEEAQPAEFDPDATGIINFHTMRLISMAAGGENEDFDMIAYVAKDRDTDVRHTHVFDCGESSDEVLATIGQAFNLAQKALEAKRALKKKTSEPAFAADRYQPADIFVPPIPIYELAPEQRSIYLDIHPKPGPPNIYLDVKPAPEDDDIEAELIQLMKKQTVYDTVAGAAAADDERETSGRLVATLNRKSRVSVRGEGVQASWSYVKPTASLRKLEAHELKQLYA